MGQALLKLKKHREFVEIAQNGRKFITSGLVLQVLKRPDDNPFFDSIRVGFVTTKKVGNAVKRSRIRRRLRSLASQILPEFAEKGSDYVLLGRASTFDRKFDLLTADLKYALRKIK